VWGGSSLWCGVPCVWCPLAPPLATGLRKDEHFIFVEARKVSNKYTVNIYIQWRREGVRGGGGLTGRYLPGAG